MTHLQIGSTPAVPTGTVPRLSARYRAGRTSTLSPNPRSEKESPRLHDFADLHADHPWWPEAIDVLAELRPGLTLDRVRCLLSVAQVESLVFTACARDDAVLGVAGWRVMTTTYADRKLHVDDLVVSARARSSGVGAALIDHLCTRGRELSCTAIDLDSRVHRFDAHRFYLRERFDIAAHHFVRTLAPQEG